EADKQLESLQVFSEWESIKTVSQFNIVKGTITAEVPFSGIIFIGLFQRSIPEGLPLYGTVLPSSLGNYLFADIKPGKYFLMATAIPWQTETTDILLPYSTLRARSMHPIIVENNISIPPQN